MKKRHFCLFAFALSLATSYANAAAFSDEDNAFYTEAIKAHAEIPYRTMVGKDPQGFVIDLDDGSSWRITDGASRMAVQRWWVNDPVVIHPTFFAGMNGSRFYFMNLRTREAASAELSRGPILGAQTNIRICFIEWDRLYLEVKEGDLNAYNSVTSFTVAPDDYRIFKRWNPGQSIILGYNRDCYSGWFSYYDYILINVERNEYVRANLGG